MTFNNYLSFYFQTEHSKTNFDNFKAIWLQEKVSDLSKQVKYLFLFIAQQSHLIFGN